MNTNFTESDKTLTNIILNGLDIESIEIYDTHAQIFDLINRKRKVLYYENMTLDKLRDTPIISVGTNITIEENIIDDGNPIFTYISIPININSQKIASFKFFLYLLGKLIVNGFISFATFRTDYDVNANQVTGLDLCIIVNITDKYKNIINELCDDILIKSFKNYIENIESIFYYSKDLSDVVYYDYEENLHIRTGPSDLFTYFDIIMKEKEDKPEPMLN